MADVGAARRVKEVEAYKQMVTDSRIFYRRGLARAIARDIVTGSIAAGVSTLHSRVQVVEFAVAVADQITKHLERLEEAELHVH